MQAYSMICRWAGIPRDKSAPSESSVTISCLLQGGGKAEHVKHIW